MRDSFDSMWADHQKTMRRGFAAAIIAWLIGLVFTMAGIAGLIYFVVWCLRKFGVI